MAILIQSLTEEQNTALMDCIFKNKINYISVSPEIQASTTIKSWTNDDIDAAYILGFNNNREDVGLDSLEKLSNELKRFNTIGKPHEFIAKLRHK